MPVIAGSLPAKIPPAKRQGTIKGLIMNYKNKPPSLWKVQSKSVYQSDRTERVEQTYKVVVPKTQCKKQSKQQQTLENKNENIRGSLLSSFFR